MAERNKGNESMAIAECFKTWTNEIRPHVVARYGENDTAALAESWNDYTDSELSGLSLQYCPAFDDTMPTDLSEEIALILEGLQISIDSVFVPFSQSRNKDSEHKSLNWRVTVKRGTRDVLTTDYSAGIAHCPGYAVTRVPSGFEARRYRSRANTVSGWTYRAATDREALDQYREDISAAECESGVAMCLNPLGCGAENVFQVQRARVMVDGRPVSRAVPILPDSVDVLYSLVMDSAVLDSGGFDEWASDYGYDTDSREAGKIYRACLETALALRAGIGGETLDQLRDVFIDY